MSVDQHDPGYSNWKRLGRGGRCRVLLNGAKVPSAVTADEELGFVDALVGRGLETRRLIGRVQIQLLAGKGGDEWIAADPDGLYAIRTLREHVDNTKRMVITRALERHEFNMTAAAKELGISRPTIYDLTKSLGISTSPPKDETRGDS